MQPKVFVRFYQARLARRHNPSNPAVGLLACLHTKPAMAMVATAAAQVPAKYPRFSTFWPSFSIWMPASAVQASDSTHIVHGHSADGVKEEVESATRSTDCPPVLWTRAFALFSLSLPALLALLLRKQFAHNLGNFLSRRNGEMARCT